MSDISLALNRELFILEDENNPNGSKSESVWPRTTLDQVFDNLSPQKKNLRVIIEDLKQEIVTGGIGNIEFPVTSVNNMTGDIVLNKKHIGLDKVDNTPDIDKPLSDPQRVSIMNMMENFEYQVDLSDLYEHINDTDNPHGVTLAALDKNGELGDRIDEKIILHNNDSNAHTDIRGDIVAISNQISNNNDEIVRKVDNAMSVIEMHYRDEHAHPNAFAKKEDISNKVIDFKTIDSVKYPSTQAVVEYVTQVATELRGEMSTAKNWIDDIIVINNRDELPLADSSSYRKAYFIKNGIGSHDEIAICRYNNIRKIYSWDISTFNTYSKYNPDDFKDSDKGLSINTSGVSQSIIKNPDMIKGIREIITDFMYQPSSPIAVSINSKGELIIEFDDKYTDPDLSIDGNGDLILMDDDSELAKLIKENLSFEIIDSNLIMTTNDLAIVDIIKPGLDNYYTKAEIQAFKFIGNLKLVPGMQPGTIRFYINGDESTMSDDVQIGGLKKLAFQDQVGDTDIKDRSITSDHIKDNVIEFRHMGNKAVSASNMRATYNTILGNLEDSTGNTVREIPINYLVEIITPLIKPIIENTISESDDLKRIIKNIHNELNNQVSP